MIEIEKDIYCAEDLVSKSKCKLEENLRLSVVRKVVRNLSWATPTARLEPGGSLDLLDTPPQLVPDRLPSHDHSMLMLRLVTQVLSRG